ncbi:hypothetical protein PUN28_020479 [Cardiocondyla obscurior]|uniref:Uncharacterized protein n=1 Tax=Cardiocondyla obscurior TaxID=286306 RepID=A0AAW2E523_9HYME
MSLPKSGAGTETSTYQSNWIFYNDLLFLTDHIIARQYVHTYVEITNTDGTSTSCKSEGEQYTSEESKSSSPAIWKTMAASIKPTKTVPPTDPIKKRKRDSEKTSDMLSHSSKNVSLLAASLSSALERFGQSQPLQPAPRHNIYSDVETMLGPIAVALSKVDGKEQVSCVMDMLAVVKRYIK